MLLPYGGVPKKWKVGAFKAGSKKRDCRYAAELAAMLAKHSTKLPLCHLKKRHCAGALLPILGVELPMSVIGTESMSIWVQ